MLLKNDYSCNKKYTCSMKSVHWCQKIQKVKLPLHFETCGWNLCATALGNKFEQAFHCFITITWRVENCSGMLNQAFKCCFYFALYLPLCFGCLLWIITNLLFCFLIGLCSHMIVQQDWARPVSQISGVTWWCLVFILTATVVIIAEVESSSMVCETCLAMEVQKSFMKSVM